MHISQLKDSRFLQKSEVGAGWDLTIRGVQVESVGSGADAEEKAVMYFEETDKVMTVNSTNGQLIAQITGQEDTDNWGGHRICVYHDPSIAFAGRLVGGIRVRPCGMATPQNYGAQRPPAAQSRQPLPPQPQQPPYPPHPQQPHPQTFPGRGPRPSGRVPIEEDNPFDR